MSGYISRIGAVSQVSLTPSVRSAPFGGSSLVRDYLLEVPAALSYYNGSPFRLDSFRAKLLDVQERFGREERERAAACLSPGSDAARARLERFVTEGGAMVTTGQQAGFLTGPMYTIFKAMSAIALADHLEQRLGVVVLPVFWAATEDHDWEEANHTYLLDPAGRLRRFELPERTDRRPLPMSETSLGEGVESVCDDVSQYVVQQALDDPLLRTILESYRSPEATVGTAFTTAIRGLLGSRDLLIADAADPALKQASRTTMKDALTKARIHEEALSAGTESLLRSGYGGQVAVLERGVNLFLHGDAGRERLYRRGEDFVVRERAGILDRAAILGALSKEPGRFSPNVLLRPVVESAVFPTLAYVGGPGEISYFGQISALFRAYDMAPPVVVPRFTGTVVEPAIERTLAKLGLGEGDLSLSREVLLDRLARREMPPRVADLLARIRSDWNAGFEQLMQEGEGLDATLVDALGAVRNRGLLEGARAERKIIRALKRGESLPHGQLDRVLASLRPLGQPQDRVIGVPTFLARRGEHFLAEVEDVISARWRLPE